MRVIPTTRPKRRIASTLRRRVGAAVSPFGLLFYLSGMTVALAQTASPADRPQTLPTRDVEITYNITRGSQTLQEHTRWLAAEQAQRVDPPNIAATAGVYFIMDHKQRRAWLIDDGQHSVMDMGPPRHGPLDADSTTRFTRAGEATVAGLHCTDWATSGGGPPTLLCLTIDGVLLRVQAGGHTLIEASKVIYAPADPALFEIPKSYTHLAPPAAAGPHAAPPG